MSSPPKMRGIVLGVAGRGKLDHPAWLLKPVYFKYYVTNFGERKEA
jgi:hypothetical protein